MQKIIPCFWFNNQAEEAVNWYLTIFDKATITNTTHYDEESAKVSGMPAGSVMTINFTLAGQNFIALNGGPQFTFSPAISMVINCEDQAEIDHYWDKLTAGGKEVQCGWLEDKYGVSWQVVPSILDKMMADPNKNKVKQVTKALLEMKKLDIKALQDAFSG